LLLENFKDNLSTFDPESKIDINKLQIPINFPNINIFNKFDSLLSPIKEIMIKNEEAWEKLQEEASLLEEETVFREADEAALKMVNENKIDNKNFAFSFISFDNSVEKDNYSRK